MNINEIFQEAFKKFQATVYFEKNNLRLRKQMVKFCSGNIEEKISDIAKKIETSNNSLDKWGKIGFFILPKKLVNQNEKESEPNCISNMYDFENNQVERLMIYADMPIELHIIATAWVLLFGAKLDSELIEECWGNRLLIADDIKGGRHLYKPYHKQYQQWWSKAMEEANHILDDNKNASIINLDIQNYYHTINFDFNELGIKPKNDFEKRIHELFIEIHKQYNKVLADNGFRKESDKYALPVGLPSSPLLANWYLKDFDEKVNEIIKPCYYGRYVDDILMVTKETKSYQSTEEYIKSNMSDLLTQIKNNGYVLELHPELKLQAEKIFLYNFDHHFSSELLSKFEKEQRERSSEFRFMSDEEDEFFKDTDFDFDSCFDDMDGTKARFKQQVDNKFKLACFLAKFIRRRMDKGKNYERPLEEKLKKFFQGSMLIKHYYFWEKLFTLYVVSEDAKSLAKLYEQINKQIDKTDIKEIKDWPDISIVGMKQTIKDDLKKYLDYALASALSVGIEGMKEKLNKEKCLKDKVEQLEKDSNIYKETFYVRTQYQRRILGFLYDEAQDQYYFENENRLKYLPYYVRISDLIFALSYNKIMQQKSESFDFNFNDIWEEAKSIFKQINCQPMLDLDDFLKTELNNALNTIDFEPNGNEESKDKITIASVNLLVKEENIKKSRRGKRALKMTDVEMYYSILDKVNKLNKCNLFVMPELSLPWRVLPQYIYNTWSNQIGFVTGMEYLNKRGTTYNFVMTCLPIEIDQVKDCIPILRLKKAYAPKEKLKIQTELFEVPNGKNVCIPLIKWHDMYFTVFNCFELTNTAERAKFVSEVDALFAIAYNKDTSYYDNIAEATSRDLHCYVILNNVSQYGGSQIVAPKKNEVKFLLKVVRGTTENNQVTIETADLDIKGLRLFQRYGDDKKEEYKPLPDGFNSGSERLKNI